MGLWELFVIAISLAMDALAIAVCKGLSLKNLRFKNAVIIALYFGSFQALMPVIGYFLGSAFSGYVESVGHWIAFGVLAFIGSKMIFDSIRGDDDASDDKIDFKTMILLATVTSIDALAVGVTFAFLKVNILVSASVIGIVTFALSIVGVYIGRFLGDRFKKKASVAGGIALILIGVKILLEHLDITAF